MAQKLRKHGKKLEKTSVGCHIDFTILLSMLKVRKHTVSFKTYQCHSKQYIIYKNRSMFLQPNKHLESTHLQNKLNTNCVNTYHINSNQCTVSSFYRYMYNISHIFARI